MRFPSGKWYFSRVTDFHPGEFIQNMRKKGGRLGQSTRTPLSERLEQAKWIYYSTNCHYVHIWSGSPQHLSSVHDRYPAIYVDDHIWNCTADLVRAAILKISLREIFQDSMLRGSRRVFASAYEDIQRFGIFN